MCAVHAKALEGTDDDIMWNGEEEDENGISVRKMKALNVKETVTWLVKLDTIWHALYIYHMQLIVKYFS